MEGIGKIDLNVLAGEAMRAQQTRSWLTLDEGSLRADLQGLDPKEKAETLARQIETTFVNLMLEEMRKTVPDGGLLGNDSASEMYRSMLDKEYARIAAEEWNFDFHEALVRQILEKSQTGHPGAESAPGNATKQNHP